MKTFNKLMCTMMIMAVSVAGAFAQNEKTAEEKAAYTKVIHQRADKIVKALHITDTAKATRVRHIIAAQYRNLNDVHERRDAGVKEIEKQPGTEQAKREAQIAVIETETTAALDKLHAAYLAQLSTELTPQQIDVVKDGMTYGVLPITYNGYLEMLPDLTKEQKAQIMAYLVEAREHAMDAGSSEKKHWWFGKYKGKINNYLSSAGYDMKKAGADWEKRRNAASGKS